VTTANNKIIGTKKYKNSFFQLLQYKNKNIITVWTIQAHQAALEKVDKIIKP